MTHPADHPLRGAPHPHDSWHPRLYAAEFIGTALLVSVGLSIVIAFWAPEAPLAGLPIAPVARRIVTGLLFGSVGAAIAFSPIGRVSGAHINPAMTFAFWIEGKMRWRDALAYGIAQMAGGVTGTLLLLAWGRTASADRFAASVPASGVDPLLPLAGECIATFLLVAFIFMMAGHEATKRFTPLVNPPLFAMLNWLEAPLSGASANPARSFGPELIGADWTGWWIYVVGPLLGAAAAVAVMRLEIVGRHRPAEARVAHPPPG
jgi:aquaporin Z